MANKERKITLEEIDPMEIYGVNNRILDRIKRYFPKLKIVARGSEIYLEGPEKDIKLFEERLGTLIEIRLRKRNLNEDDVDRLFDYENFPEVDHQDITMPEDTYNIVYGAINIVPI